MARYMPRSPASADGRWKPRRDGGFTEKYNTWQIGLVACRQHASSRAQDGGV